MIIGDVVSDINKRSSDRICNTKSVCLLLYSNDDCCIFLIFLRYMSGGQGLVKAQTMSWKSSPSSSQTCHHDLCLFVCLYLVLDVFIWMDLKYLELIEILKSQHKRDYCCFRSWWWDLMFNLKCIVTVDGSTSIINIDIMIAYF